jgi:hypothetical protein
MTVQEVYCAIYSAIARKDFSDFHRLYAKLSVKEKREAIEISLYMEIEKGNLDGIIKGKKSPSSLLCAAARSFSEFLSIWKSNRTSNLSPQERMEAICMAVGMSQGCRWDFSLEENRELFSTRERIAATRSAVYFDLREENIIRLEQHRPCQWGGYSDFSVFDDEELKAMVYSVIYHPAIKQGKYPMVVRDFLVAYGSELLTVDGAEKPTIEPGVLDIAIYAAMKDHEPTVAMDLLLFYDLERYAKEFKAIVFCTICCALNTGSTDHKFQFQEMALDLLESHGSMLSAEEGKIVSHMAIYKCLEYGRRSKDIPLNLWDLVELPKKVVNVLNDIIEINRTEINNSTCLFLEKLNVLRAQLVLLATHDFNKMIADYSTHKITQQVLKAEEGALVQLQSIASMTNQMILSCQKVTDDLIFLESLEFDKKKSSDDFLAYKALADLFNTVVNAYHTFRSVCFRSLYQ